MHCKNLLVNDCCDGEAVKAVCESLPQFYVIPALTLIVEAIDAVNGGAFVVTT
jgi:hypothetical protein